MQPDFKRTVYVVLSIAYRRVNDVVGALRTLSRAILKYPRYAESYLARGQIYIFQKKWDRALVDFKRVVSLMPTNGIGFLGQGDALKGIGNFSQALDSYSAGIEQDAACRASGLFKRGSLYYQLKQFELARHDFVQLVA